MPSADAILLQTGGLVLAGGKSRRFGSEKALATFRGSPLLDIALDRLTRCSLRAVSAALESGATARAAECGLAVISDEPGDPAGPLAGVKRGLAWASAAGLSFLATLPCDAPRLPIDVLERLASSVGDAPAAFATTPDGDQPLCALWSITLLKPLTASLRSGHPPTHAFLDAHGAARLRFDDPAAFANVNTPGDLARLEMRP